MPTEFNPKEFKGKKLYYVRMSYPGVYRIWEWHKRKKEYLPRSRGSKYYACKKSAGVQTSKCFGTCEQAKEWRDSKYQDQESQESKEFTFAQVKKKYFEHIKSKVKITTYETYEVNTKHLKFFDRMQVSQITARVIDAWITEIKKPAYLAMQHRTRLTYDHELRLVRQILNFYSEYLDPDGVFQVPIKKRHAQDVIVNMIKYKEMKTRNQEKYIPRADCERFLEELRKKSHASEMDLLIYLVGYFHLRTGPRVGETCALAWEDLNLKTGEGVISKTVHWARKKERKTCISSSTKTGKSRAFMITDRNLLGELRDWRLKSGRSQGLIFSVDGVTPMAYRAIQARFTQVFKKLGLPYASTHILRHSFGTDFLEVTQNPLALKEILGHSDVRQTQHYAKTTDAVVEKALKIYGESFEKEEKKQRPAG